MTKNEIAAEGGFFDGMRLKIKERVAQLAR